MGHLALYRQFRPRTFDEIRGQSHVTTTLKNQIKAGQIGHAYLFCGTRGTGKTTAAKVFARAINCLDNTDGNPCLNCDNCRDTNPIDLIELDAASNNGVDYIRDIIEKAAFSPVNGKYKVYIVDEVHMLSANAFNAFLKTLEEPPAHAVFVLCTTEPQKIPQTILSRCMRFDFRLISLNDLVKLLTDIFNKVGAKATSEAITAICTAGEGSVRDTLSIADRCISFSRDKTLEYEDVLNILGATDNTAVERLATAVLDGDAAGILSEIKNLTDAGKNVVSLAKDLANVFRNIIICSTVPTAKQLLNLPENRFEVLDKAAKKYNVKKVLHSLDVFVGCENDLRFALNPRILLEAIALRAAASSGEVNLDDLQSRVNRLERKVEELLKSPPVSADTQRDDRPQSLSQAARQPQSTVVESARAEEKPKSTKVNMASGGAIWGKVLGTLRSSGETVLFDVCENVEKVFVEQDSLLVAMVKSGGYAILSKQDNQSLVKNIVSQYCPYRFTVRLVEEKDPWEQSFQQFKNIAGDVPLYVDGKKVN